MPQTNISTSKSCTDFFSLSVWGTPDHSSSPSLRCSVKLDPLKQDESLCTWCYY